MLNRFSKVRESWARLKRGGHFSPYTQSFQSPDCVNIVYEGGNTALHFAAKEGRTTDVKTLLQFNADIHKQNNDGYDALMLAAIHGHRKTVKLLLSAGADVFARDERGCSADDLAEEYMRLDIRSLILRNKANNERRRASLILQSETEVMYNKLPESKTDVQYNELPDSKTDVQYNELPESKTDVQYNELPESKTDVQFTEPPESKTDVQYNVPPESKTEVKCNVPPESKTEVKCNVPPESKTEVKCNVPPEIKTEVKCNVPPEIKTEVKCNVPPESKTEVKCNVPPESKTEVQYNLQSEGQTQIKYDLVPESKTGVKYYILRSIRSTEVITNNGTLNKCYTEVTPSGSVPTCNNSFSRWRHYRYENSLRGVVREKNNNERTKQKIDVQHKQTAHSELTPTDTVSTDVHHDLERAAVLTAKLALDSEVLHGASTATRDHHDQSELGQTLAKGEPTENVHPVPDAMLSPRPVHRSCSYPGLKSDSDLAEQSVTNKTDVQKQSNTQSLFTAHRASKQVKSCPDLSELWPDRPISIYITNNIQGDKMNVAMDRSIIKCGERNETTHF